MRDEDFDWRIAIRGMSEDEVARVIERLEEERDAGVRVVKRLLKQWGNKYSESMCGARAFLRVSTSPEAAPAPKRVPPLKDWSWPWQRDPAIACRKCFGAGGTAQINGFIVCQVCDGKGVTPCSCGYDEALTRYRNGEETPGFDWMGDPWHAEDCPRYQWAKAQMRGGC